MTPRLLRLADYTAHAVVLPSGEIDYSPCVAALAADVVDTTEAQITQTIDLRGEWTIAQPVELTAHRSTIWGGCFRVIAEFTDPTAPAVRISANYSTITGFLHVYGLGSTPLATRKTHTLVQVGDALDLVCTGFELLTATHGGLVCDPTKNQIGARFGTIHLRDIGSAAGAAPGHVARLDLPYTARVDSGSHGSHLQYSRLSVDILGEGWSGYIEPGQPWTHSDSNGTTQVGTIQAVDETGGTVDLFPKLLDKNQQTGTLTLSGGMGLGTIGANNVGTSASVIHGLRVGQLRAVGVNGGGDGCLIAEDGCGVALRLPATNSGTTAGYSVARWHAEGMVAVHLLDVGRSSDTSILIGATSGLDLDRCWSLSPVRPDDFTITTDDDASGVQGHSFEEFRGWCLNDRGAWLTTPVGTEIGSELVAANTFLSAHPEHAGAVPPVLRQDTPIINLEHVSGLHRWGHSSARLSVVGSDGGQPSQITIKSTPSHGEIELAHGQTDPYLRVEPLAGGADVLIYRDAGLWRVRIIPFV